MQTRLDASTSRRLQITNTLCLVCEAGHTEHRDAMRDGQQKNKPPEKKVRPPSPRFRLGEVWSVDDLLTEMEVSEETFNKWVKLGLPVQRPFTKSRYVLTDHLMEVWGKIK